MRLVLATDEAMDQARQTDSPQHILIVNRFRYGLYGNYKHTLFL